MALTLLYLIAYYNRIPEHKALCAKNDRGSKP